MVLTEESRIVAMKDHVSRDLAGDVVILNLEDGVYYGLNPVGASVWSLIQEPRTFAGLRNALLDEYDVDATRLESDLRALLAELAEKGLIGVTAM